MALLHGQLRALGGDGPGADRVVTACLMWVADTLVDIAAAVGDPRSAGVLVDEASAVLAALARDGRGRPDAVTPTASLTERERMVLVRLQDDVPLRQIGSDLFISFNTVKSHARALYRKLGASSRTEALERARELRLL
ncbi:LuxR C-terminal-related transcriptional regulator [Streptomyces sp. Act143]|uniref:LuxR C-terminal-related transcriptional regulator n=1 Tax=Streptomyces sp. Act143 TaxID=2200760 RepID=UPI0015E81A98|nr:LuxR C-terminal-related transcriptional regulator [Streptomyces sp. Act143]